MRNLATPRCTARHATSGCAPIGTVRFSFGAVRHERELHGDGREAALPRALRLRELVRHEPGYTDVDRIVRIETSLYSIREGKRLWSGVSRTLNPRDVRELVDDVVRAVGAELEEQGLAP